MHLPSLMSGCVRRSFGCESSARTRTRYRPWPLLQGERSQRQQDRCAADCNRIRGRRERWKLQQELPRKSAGQHRRTTAAGVAAESGEGAPACMCFCCKRERRQPFCCETCCLFEALDLAKAFNGVWWQGGGDRCGRGGGWRVHERAARAGGGL